MTRPRIILASTSAIRRKILDASGLAYTALRPDADEAALKAALVREGIPVEALAVSLAREKALSIDVPGALVIGADQIMEMDGETFDKPRSVAEAAERLERCAGRAHRLINGVVVARDGATIFENTEIATLHMRAMSRADIDAYLAEAGEDVLSSVGAYQVEALGSRLFDRIDGDYFAVLGLSLFPLLRFLRGAGALPW
ncbi:MAG: Maf family protein [Parvularculaceae bacterium]|nr:Maf family protein [Parvularculaceae bacterium]